jgi:hypothetical protein
MPRLVERPELPRESHPPEGPIYAKASCQHVSPGPGNENRFQIAGKLKARLLAGYGIYGCWSVGGRLREDPNRKRDSL